MNRLFTAVGVAAILAGSLLPASSQALAAPTTAAPMSVKILASTGPRTVSRNGTVTFKVQVRGITLDIRHIGKRPTAGHGHLQYYLDRIPSDAYRRADLRHNWIAAVATPIFIFSLNASPVKIKPGKHRFLIALAKNNDILYRGVPPASLTVTVK